MGTSARKKDSSLSIAIVVAIVLIASVFLLLRPSPEQEAAVSTDGLLRMEGLSRSSGTLRIERLDDIATSIPQPQSPIYEATITQEGTLESGELTFLFSELDSSTPIQDVAVYVFNRQSLAWEALPTFFDLDQQTVTAQIEFSGSLLVGLGTRVL